VCVCVMRACVCVCVCDAFVFLAWLLLRKQQETGLPPQVTRKTPCALPSFDSPPTSLTHPHLIQFKPSPPISLFSQAACTLSNLRRPAWKTV
jgi:hypothetical protein